MRNLGVGALIVLVILLVVFGPFFTIWSLNTLFPVLAIPFTFETWCATILLGMFLRGNVSVSKK
jgi:hypothetical protein